MYDTESRMAPPPPRIPSAANPSRLAPRGALAPYSPEADRVLSGLHDLLDAAHGAVAAVSAGRPGGSDWEAAETAAVRTGKPKPFADLIRGDADRYAQAVIESRTIVARLDDARRAGQPVLSEASTAIRARLDELNEELAHHADIAWTRRSVGAGTVALEEADRILAEMSVLSALATWCAGTDREYQHQGRGLLVLDESANAKVVCARAFQKGIVPQELPQSVTRNLPPGFTEWVRDVERRHLVSAR